ncbi:MAG: GAF domain-containing protein [Acidobacteriota bacterium]|nr:GAF domain-containing protein [Acidobacteriota bacterium]
MAPIPENEEHRLEVLNRFRILDSASEKSFDEITRLAASVCDTPISLLTFIDRNRQWIKSNCGLSISETSREVAFCSHAIMHPGVFEVEDALQDDRFASNPLVTADPNIRFYAGMPLVTQTGEALGTLCVIDRKARQLTPEQRIKLKTLAQMAMLLLEVRKSELDAGGTAAGG